MVPNVFSFELATNVVGDAHHIVHHGFRISEDVAIYFLVNVTNACATLAVRCGVGFVNVADFESFGVENFAVNLEFFRNFLELLFLIGHSGI